LRNRSVLGFVKLTAMDVPAVVIAATWAAAECSVAFREWNRKRRGHRVLQARPEKRAAEIADGELVRVHGLSVADRTLVAPLSGRPCIGYSVAVEEREGLLWRKIAQREEFLPFRIVADGRDFHVDGPFLLALKIDARRDKVKEPSPAEASVLGELRVSPRDFLKLRRNLRIREARIEEHDVIWVSGLACVAVDPRGEREVLRGQPIRREIFGTPREPTVLADELDGRVSDLV
jgi:hypothetical protein